VTLDLANEPKPQTCKDCKHWHILPRPRDASGAVDMSVPVAGECREHLHAGLMRHQSGAMVWVSGYPPVSEENPICGRFQARPFLL
jgi:hypothetical protein